LGRSQFPRKGIISIAAHNIFVHVSDVIFYPCGKSLRNFLSFEVLESPSKQNRFPSAFAA
jgi:hypothetical protein